VTWFDCEQGTVPGAAGLAKPHLDTSESAESILEVAPKLAAAMIGDRSDARTELALLERKAISAYEARNIMKASNCYMDLIKKVEALHDEETYWMDLTKARVAMSRIRLRLGNVHEAEEWQQDALALLEQRQSEDPSDPSACTYVCVRYHQSQAKAKRKGQKSAPQLSPLKRQSLIQQKLLWAEVQIQRAAVMVSKITDQGVNLNYEAFTILNRAATLIQEVLGPESSRLAAALRDMAEVQALRGRFRDGLDIYKRALRIETRATGYDGYAGHPCIADMLHRMAEINIVLGKCTEAVGLLQRAIHIYGAVDAQGLLHPKIPAVKECLGRAFQGCLRYGEASCAFQDGFDCCSRRIALHDRQGKSCFPCRPRNSCFPVGSSLLSGFSQNC
jgi:tetratricopeptide (TPR) repeat protein